MISPRRPIAPKHVADHYDELDRLYRNVWGEHVHHGLWLDGRESVPEATRNLIDRVAAVLKLSAGSRVCDVGCGYGGTSRVLASEFGAQVTGVTLSRAQFEYGQSLESSDSARLIYGDFLDNEFTDNSFDAAFSIESSEHFADKPKLFSEMFRILNPGGRVAVCAWLAAETPRSWERRWLLEPICFEGRLPGLGTETEYRAFFGDAGFQDIEFEDVTRKVSRTWPIIVFRVLLRLPWDPAAWRFLFGRPRNAVFGITIPRIALAYRTGAMRYGVFSARKPGE
jgi:tocopherol O-methyltransferase